MTDHQPKHVFISYVRENQDQVDCLCQDLENHGVNVWLDRHSIKPGARWKSAIQEAIRSGNFFIACFSDEYTSKTKSYMNEELTLATEELRQYASDREWFIPVLLSECDVPARSIGAGETLLDINWFPLYEDWSTGIQRILSVIKPIPPEVHKLISALRAEDKDVREQTAVALGKIGPEAKAAVPDLIEALKDKDEDKDVRKAASQSLGNIGPEAKAAVPALIEALKDENEWVRYSAAEGLGGIGLEAKAAVPALIEVLKDRDAWVRKNSAYAIGRIGPEAKAAVPAMIEALKKNIDESVRWKAAKALGSIGPEAKAAVPALIEALKDENKGVREQAAYALGNIGPEAKAAVPALIDALEDPTASVQWTAMGTLREINTPEAQKALKEYNKQKPD